MAILGILTTIVGVVMTAIGGSLRNTWEYQAAKVAKAWGWLDAEEKFYIFIIDAVFVIGIIALIVGIAMVVFGFIRKSSGGSSRGYSAPSMHINVNTNYAAPKQYTCRQCGADVSADMMFCPNCGSADKVEKVASAPYAAPKPAPAFCPGCGSAVNPGETFCPNCGTKV